MFWNDLTFLKNFAVHKKNRVILGTIAVENEEFLREMVKKYGNKIAVSVDAKNEKVAVKGWTETVELNSVQLSFAKSYRTL